MFATSKNGNITLTDIEGYARLEGTFGKIKVTIARKNCVVQSNNCEIELNRITGNVNITNSFGKLSVSEAENGISFTNSNGNVAIWSVKGDVRGDNRYRNIEVRSVEGNVLVKNSNAPVNVAGIKGEADIENSHAPIFIENISSNVFSKNQNGNIEIDLRGQSFAEDIGEKTVKASSTYGVIKIILPDNPSAKLTAETIYGDIYTGFQLEMDVMGPTKRAAGDIFNGKHYIELETSNSNIYIETNAKK